MFSTITSGILFSMVFLLPDLHNRFYLVWGIEITKPAYLGSQWSFDYIVFSEHKTWLEALDACKSLGGDLQYKKYLYANWYIKIKAAKNGWSVSDDVWLGMIKQQYSDTWYEVRNNCPERKGISGEKYHERQCAVLNMSAVSSSDKSLIYASSCDERDFGFVCLQSFGQTPQDVESYPKTEMVEKGFTSFQWNISSESECAKKAFNNFLCYAATFFPEDKYCVAECTQLTNILDTVSLVNSSKNSTVLLRAHSKVFINHTKSALASNTSQYPCLSETFELTEPSKVSTDSTPATQTSEGSSTLQSLESTTISISPTYETTTFRQTQEDTAMVTVTSEVDTRTVTEIQSTSNTYSLTQTGTTVSQISNSKTTEVYSECCYICSSNQDNITTQVLKQKVINIKRILTVNITFLSSTVRKKTSAPDDRRSSLAMGTLGICVIIGIILAIISGDLVYVVSFVKFICPCLLHNKKRMTIVHD